MHLVSKIEYFKLPKRHFYSIDTLAAIAEKPLFEFPEILNCADLDPLQIMLPNETS